MRQQASVIIGNKRENLDQILYEDAERRRRDLARMKNEIDRARDTPQGKPYHNEKSEKYVQKRFERELKGIQEEIVLGRNTSTNFKNPQKDKESGHPQNVPIPDTMLDFSQLIHVLIKLGFLPRDKAPEQHEEELVKDLWTFVKGEDNNGVNFNTLRVVLLNIIGIKVRDREYDDPSDGVSSKHNGEAEGHPAENNSANIS